MFTILTLTYYKYLPIMLQYTSFEHPLFRAQLHKKISLISHHIDITLILLDLSLVTFITTIIRAFITALEVASVTYTLTYGLPPHIT